MKKDCFLEFLGTLDYEEGLKKQRETADLVRASGVGICLACTHPAVITLGKRGQPLNDILASMKVLRSQNIKIVATERGGQATLHNAGQLVLYPILPLRTWQLGVRHFVECLERATAFFLAEYGMEVTRGFEPGLFVDTKKIAAFGIRIDRGVSMHGLAINLNNDLIPFKLIKQCGMVVEPTNLQHELSLIGIEKNDWDFGNEAEKWLKLFMAELQGAATESVNTTSDCVM